MTTQSDPALRQHMFRPRPHRVWWRLLREYGGVEPRRGALARILLTSLGTLPLRLAESAPPSC